LSETCQKIAKFFHFCGIKLIFYTI